MEHERRKEGRWRAADFRNGATLRLEDGRSVEAVVVDVSEGGIGLRVAHRGLKAGMRVAVRFDLPDDAVEVPAVVRFVDRMFPRVGLQVEASDRMAPLVGHARRHGFLMAELRDDTLAVHGSLTLAAVAEFKMAKPYRKLDLSGVRSASVAGVGIVLGETRKGVRIDCCSAGIAPLFESLGICRGKLCVSAVPCDLPKTWTPRAKMSAL